MKKLIFGILGAGLVCVIGFFVILGVLGGSFAATCLSSDAAQLEGSNNQEKIYNFWVKNGFSPATAAGITANIKMESGYSPFRQEMSARWPNGGYGIAQFTGGQRQAVTEYMAPRLGNDFATYYNNEYGGAVRAENGFVPEGIPLEINDKFLSAQLGYLLEYMGSFKPSSISARVNGFKNLTGLTVPGDATLKEYMLSLNSASTAAKAWTFLYEYPGDINNAANDRAVMAETLLGQLSGLTPGDIENAGYLKGACGVGNVVAPTNAEGTIIVTSGFEMRLRSNGIYRAHQGIDIVTGDTIQAMMGGTVETATYSSGYGWYVKIDHGNGTHSLYGHMVPGSLKVSEGDPVNAGQPLGVMGNSGDSEGVHLHFQVWQKDVLVNPWAFLMEQGIELQWAPFAYPRNEKPGPL